MEKRKVLGRGLDSLLGARRSALAVAVEPAPAVEEAAGEIAQVHAEAAMAPVADGTTGEVIDIQAAAESRTSSSITQSNQVVQIEIDAIDRNPYQTRSHFDPAALDELAESIKAQGVLQPIVVRPGKVSGRYLLVLGERRLRASKLAGKPTVPAIVKRVSDQQAAELTVIENLQRQDLNCIEQAEAFGVLSRDFNLTQVQISERVGLSRESVANYMRMLKLPDRVKEHLASGAIRFSEAKELMRLEHPDDMVELADDMAKSPVNIKHLRARIEMMLDRGLLGGRSRVETAAQWVDPNVRAEQTELERSLGLRVKIRDNNGKGKIEISYGSVEDYERVVELLRGKS